MIQAPTRNPKKVNTFTEVPGQFKFIITPSEACCLSSMVRRTQTPLEADNVALNVQVLNSHMGGCQKLWPIFGHPRHYVPYNTWDPKRDHNFDNHPYTSSRHVLLLLAPESLAPRSWIHGPLNYAEVCSGRGWRCLFCRGRHCKCFLSRSLDCNRPKP